MCGVKVRDDTGGIGGKEQVWHPPVRLLSPLCLPPTSCYQSPHLPTWPPLVRVGHCRGTMTQHTSDIYMCACIGLYVISILIDLYTVSFLFFLPLCCLACSLPFIFSVSPCIFCQQACPDLWIIPLLLQYVLPAMQAVYFSFLSHFGFPLMGYIIDPSIVCFPSHLVCPVMGLAYIPILSPFCLTLASLSWNI